MDAVCTLDEPAPKFRMPYQEVDSTYRENAVPEYCCGRCLAHNVEGTIAVCLISRAKVDSFVGTCNAFME